MSTRQVIVAGTKQNDDVIVTVGKTLAVISGTQMKDDGKLHRSIIELSPEHMRRLAVHMLAVLEELK